MTWWKQALKWLRGRARETGVDYYAEGVQLLQKGAYHDAVISFRLALRESPRDPAVMQQIAIAHTRMGVTEEAVRVYRQVLERHPDAAGAHYGLAFLLLRDGQEEAATQHLHAFLRNAPQGEEADRHIAHAKQTLAELKNEAVRRE